MQVAEFFTKSVNPESLLWTMVNHEHAEGLYQTAVGLPRRRRCGCENLKPNMNNGSRH